MPSFGERLKRERELRGIQLHEIAQATKISVRFLEALETDRIDLLPGGIFRRSFVKAYSDHVGLDAGRMVSEFMAAHGDGPAATPAAVAAPVTPARAKTSLYRRLFFGSIVVLAAAGALRLAMHRAHPAAVARVPVPAAPELVFPPDRLLPSVSSASMVGPIAGPLVLELAARESCWVGVQADGRVVMSRVLSSGESQRLEANEEIVLSVGNAGALSVRINDRPGLALGRRGEVRRNIVITKESLPSLVETAPGRESHSG